MHHCTFKVMIYTVDSPGLAVCTAHDIENMTGNFTTALVKENSTRCHGFSALAYWSPKQIMS